MSSRSNRPEWSGLTGPVQRLFGVTDPPRAWHFAVVYSAIVTALMLVFAVFVNDWIGRTIHWDWVAYFGALAFLGLTVGRRARIL